MEEHTDNINDLKGTLDSIRQSHSHRGSLKEKENSKIKEYRRFISSRRLSMEIAAAQHEILYSKFNKIWKVVIAFSILLSSTITILSTISSDTNDFIIPITIISATNAALTAISTAYGLHEKPTQHKTANGSATEIADEITRFLVKRPGIDEMSTFSDVVEEKIKAFRALEPVVPMDIKHTVAKKRLAEV
jgi:hypothetical protein